MEKRVLLTELVDRGTHLRKEITPTATITDNGKYPAGTFWDANKTLNEIVAGATDAQDTLKEVEDKLNKEISDARKAEQDIKDQIDDILGIDAQDIADLKQIVEDLDPETGILSVIDAKANTADLGTAAYKDVAASGNASNTQVVMGNDTRLTDARTPLTHTHSYNNLTNKPDLSLKANVADISISVDNTNGHDYVDLGLPSGTLWAKMNVGASSETDYGNYYKYGLGAAQYSSSQTDYTGMEDPLSESLDTVAQAWGGNWRMPTKTECEELIGNTNFSWTTINGINGGKFTSKTDSSKYIFLPAGGNASAGLVWGIGNSCNYRTSTPMDSTYVYILILSYYSSNASVLESFRSDGYLVRGVISNAVTNVLGKTVTDAERTAWNAKADASNYYTKAEIDLMLANL